MLKHTQSHTDGCQPAYQGIQAESWSAFISRPRLVWCLSSKYPDPSCPLSLGSSFSSPASHSNSCYFGVHLACHFSLSPSSACHSSSCGHLHFTDNCSGVVTHSYTTLCCASHADHMLLWWSLAARLGHYPPRPIPHCQLLSVSHPIALCGILS